MAHRITDQQLLKVLKEIYGDGPAPDLSDPEIFRQFCIEVGRKKDQALKRLMTY